jgi:hypothetical protein
LAKEAEFFFSEMNGRQKRRNAEGRQKETRFFFSKVIARQGVEVRKFGKGSAIFFSEVIVG